MFVLIKHYSSRSRLLYKVYKRSKNSLSYPISEMKQIMTSYQKSFLIILWVVAVFAFRKYFLNIEL